MNEKELRDESMDYCVNLIHEVNEIFNYLDIKNLPNIGIELSNKMTILSLLFYKEEQFFYSSAISDPITIYLVDRVKEGIRLLGCYEMALRDASKRNYGKYVPQDPILVRQRNEIFEKYNDVVREIKNFDLENNIVDAVKHSLPIIDKNNSEKNRDYLVKIYNIDLESISLNVRIPNVNELNGYSKGKKL